MVAEFPFFVNRQEELEVIRHAIARVGERQAVLVHGPGGIGKTRLLQKVREEYARAPSLIVTEVLDLCDVELRIPIRWENQVAQQLGEKQAFAGFLAQYRELLEFEAREVSIETQAKYREQAHEAFVQGVNDVAGEKRIVLLMDTLEDAQRAGALWPHLLSLMPRLNNVVWILAGRRCDDVRADVEARLGAGNVHWLPLSGFDQHAADEYFDEYFKRPSVVSLDPEMREKIRLLTDGRPILMALAILWLENEMPLPEIEQMSVSELQAMSRESLGRLQEEVKQALVRRLLTFSNTVDKVVLNMAWVERRFDAEIMRYLMGISEADVLDRLASLPFVKARPGESYVTHDEMRDMTVQYTWPLVDSDGTLRRRIDQKMIEYYVQKTEELDAQVNELKRAQKEAAEAGDTKAALRAFEEWSEKSRLRDVLETERLFYTLRADRERGIQQFVETYDWATANSRVGFRDMLWEEVQHFEARFGRLEDFRVDVRGAKHLLDAGDAAAAKSKGAEILEQLAKTGDEKIETLVHLGNCALRLGRPLEAHDFYQQAHNLCTEQNLHRWLAVVENGLGLARRSSGNWDEAARHYQAGVDACEKYGSPAHHLASALNNYAYVLGLRGRYDEAIAMCEQALNLRQDLGFWRGVGISYSTLGELYRYQMRYERALEYYAQALRIFEKPGDEDWEWLAVVYQERAIAQAYAGELDEAWTGIRRALDLCERYNTQALPWALNRAGRIARFRKEYAESERLLQRGIAEAEKAGDIWFLLATMVELMELRYDRLRGRADVQALRKEFEDLAVRIGEYEQQGYGFRDLFGRMRRILGHVLYDQGDYDQALSQYKEAYSLIASGYYGSHGLHKLPEELEELGKRIDDLPAAEAIRWCNELRRWGEGTGKLIGLIGFCATHRHKAQQRLAAEAAR